MANKSIKNSHVKLLMDYIKRESKNALISVDDFIFYIKRKIKTLEINTLTAPLEVHWDITDRCNLNCIYCYANRLVLNELELNQIYEIIDKLEEAGVLQITLEGGEPFLREDILEIIKYIKARNFSLVIISNGTLIKDDFVKEVATILNKKTDHFQLTLDGPCESIHNLNRPNSFKKVINTIKNFLNYNIPFVVRFVVTSNNFHSMVETYELLHDLGFKGIFEISPLILKGKADPKLLPPIDRALLNFIDLLEKSKTLIYPYVTGLFTTKRNIYIFLKKSGFDCDFSTIGNFFLNCTGGRAKIVISPNGDIYPCTLMREDRYYLGNILKNSLLEIWNNKNTECIRNKILKSLNKCFICEFNKVCSYCPCRECNT